MHWGPCLGKQLEVVCHPWVQRGRGQPLQPSSQSPRWIYRCIISYIVCFVCLILDHIPAGGGISSFHSTGVPKTHPPHQAGGLGARYRMDLEALLIPRAKNLLLWRIFLSSNQWKCVYQETMFDLDKCFTDVNKAGERDRGRRDKEGWERRKAATGRTRREKK